MTRLSARQKFVAMLIWLLGANSACSKSEKVAAIEGKPPTAPAAPAKSPSQPPSAEVVQLCAHRVPADLCTQCSPELAEVFKEKGDWCAEHGVPESHCFKCNPKLDFTKPAPVVASDWCGEHGVPESMCTKCKPELVAKYVEKGDFCREHGFPESVCPICHPEKVRAAGHEPPVFPKPGTKVKLASADTEREIGIESEKVEKRPFANSLEVVGQLQFNENRLARLSARGEGVVVEVKVDIGDDVKRGQTLVLLASGSIGQEQSRIAGTKGRVEAAKAALERERGLLSSGISSRREVEQAQAELTEAQAQLAGGQASLRAAGAGEGGVGRYTLAAPFPGTVVSRHAVAGQSVAPGHTILEVADLGIMWALLDVPEDKASLVQPGQKVRLTSDAGGAQLEGIVSRMSAVVDPQTRTVRARVDLPNAKRTLRAGTFVRATIELAAATGGALLIPRESVQFAEGQQLVFVRTSAGQYDPRPITLGARAGKYVEVARGLSAGEEIVTTGAFLLKTEILKDSIGAGCVDD
ncbi:MAG TPA: efflux RND transporter periplasmic adaptor subunit [Polyangia bacterium]